MSKKHRRQPAGPVGISVTALIEALPHLVVVTDDQGEARLVNGRWLSLTGLSRAASTGQRWLDVQAPENAAEAAQAWTQAHQDAQPFDATYVMHAASGQVVVRWHHEPLRVGGALRGVVTGWLCTGVTLQEGRSAVAAGSRATNPSAASQEKTLEYLALEVSWLGDILTHLPLGVLIVDAQTRRIKLVNPRAQHLLGISLASGMTLGRLENLRLGNGARLIAERFALNRALDGTPVNGEELALQRTDGSVVRLRVSAEPIFDALGQVMTAVLTLEDVTARHDASDQERLSSEMQRAQEAVLLHGGEPVTPERFLILMGELHEQMGSPSLEGRLIALLLLRAEPVSLGEAASALGVSKVAVSKVSTVMQQRGDLQVIKSFSSREHLLALTDHNYIRDLSVRRVASWAISILCDSLLSTNHLDPATTQQIRAHLEIHTRVAVALEKVLSPIEQRQAIVLATHLRENWDAVPAPQRKSDTDPENPD